MIYSLVPLSVLSTFAPKFANEFKNSERLTVYGYGRFCVFKSPLGLSEVDAV